ncbi:unnamed protein product [Dovyalis caffra]|uniref:LOB domain-containing protein n=1 Tax=Dovyalis caffra TaxID=77055 RepID=A0AAV1QT50_9ROSI|nr:unnamed protein product [Dovyalis caffra]
MEDCVLAPYFPAERTQEFQAVHKVFGVSNVVKIVKEVNEERRKETADSLVWEAACRQDDPVLGCYGKYKKIKEELDLLKMQQQPLTNQNLNHQNQLGQQQGVVVYNKQMVAWNGTNGINNRGNNIGGGFVNNNMVNYCQDNSNLIFDSIPHKYRWEYVQNPDKSNQERDASSLLLLPTQPPPPLRHQYYLPGQFGPAMDNTVLFMGEEDEKYFASHVIKCKDGSKSFSKDRLNDNFCDCLDGTDEPGTSACPRGKFYCGNVGSTPKFIFSSRVNDQICDCCDGSDEYGSGINCPNTCIMGGNLEYKAGNYISRIDMKESSKGVILEELFQKAKGSIDLFKLLVQDQPLPSFFIQDIHQPSLRGFEHDMEVDVSIILNVQEPMLLRK